MELEDSKLNGCCNLGWDVGQSSGLQVVSYISQVVSSFGNRNCCVIHHLKLTAQEKLLVEEMIMNYFESQGTDDQAW
jgi:hypothetical protein